MKKIHPAMDFKRKYKEITIDDVPNSPLSQNNPSKPKKPIKSIQIGRRTGKAFKEDNKKQGISLFSDETFINISNNKTKKKDLIKLFTYSYSSSSSESYSESSQTSSSKDLNRKDKTINLSSTEMKLPTLNKDIKKQLDENIANVSIALMGINAETPILQSNLFSSKFYSKSIIPSTLKESQNANEEMSNDIKSQTHKTLIFKSKEEIENKLKDKKDESLFKEGIINDSNISSIKAEVSINENVTNSFEEDKKLLKQINNCDILNTVSPLSDTDFKNNKAIEVKDISEESNNMNNNKKRLKKTKIITKKSHDGLIEQETTKSTNDNIKSKKDKKDKSKIYLSLIEEDYEMEKDGSNKKNTNSDINDTNPLLNSNLQIEVKKRKSSESPYNKTNCPIKKTKKDITENQFIKYAFSQLSLIKPHEICLSNKDKEQKYFGINNRYPVRNRVPRLNHLMGEKVKYIRTEYGDEVYKIYTSRVEYEKILSQFNIIKKKKVIKPFLELEVNFEEKNESNKTFILIFPMSKSRVFLNKKVLLNLKVEEAMGNNCIKINDKLYKNNKKGKEIKLQKEDTYEIFNYSKEELVVSFSFN